MVLPLIALAPAHLQSHKNMADQALRIGDNDYHMQHMILHLMPPTCVGIQRKTEISWSSNQHDCSDAVTHAQLIGKGPTICDSIY